MSHRYGIRGRKHSSLKEKPLPPLRGKVAQA
jgi:hypothetical protein